MQTDSQEQAGNPTGHGRPEDWPKYIKDQDWAKYTSEEHGVWKTLFERQSEIVKGRGCQEYLDGITALDMDPHQIPNFAEASKILKAKTGWEVVAVDGLIPDLPFFQLLAERKFPAGDFIRRPDQLDYIEEPDVFHDFFGHVPLLANPVFADYMEAYGKGGLKAFEHGTIKNLARLYWYTVEFGLIQQDDGMRIYGAGILSSPGETVFSVESKSPNRVGFDLKRIMQTNYKYDDYQPTYFVIDSFDQTYADFSALYEQIKEENVNYAPQDLAPNDKVFTKGTQDYLNSKK